MEIGNKYDIFISYRRENGEDKARILNQYLSTIGYKVFFDHESGLSGEFETEILAAVEIAPVFLMLMTPNCFDRCVDEGDWVRREIERAQIFGKEIIPIRPNYDHRFDSFPDILPESIRLLSKLQFAEIDFHKNFKATANIMIDEQIKKVVEPTIITMDTGNIGARIHFFSDISCRVLSYGNQIAVTDAADTTIGAVVRLLKGRHLLEYKSIEHEADSYKETYCVADNDLEDFVNIELQPIKEARKKKEEALKAEEDRKAAEEKARMEQEQSTRIDENFKYDLFFCYSRQDASIVRLVYQHLTQAGYRCWIDMDGIASGQTFAEQIVDVINDSKCFLFFHSWYSHQSKWARNELMLAIDLRKPIIPIKLDDSPFPRDLEIILSSLDYYRFDMHDREDLVKLSDAIRKVFENKNEY